MSPVAKYALGAGAVALVSWFLFPNLIALLITAGLVAAPVVAYFMLDESQRARLKRVRRRQLGR
ncbi:hypothetical protein [Bailinhaonella thermotolerans]|uniref:Uncharacterized protein n=1 Tax=Bailinhaonella thermotolerans TaxID=1070861 RepID=A0A3A4AP89_9ACTN|nr:hypothetical protein [Bailinhaonella thermotolerans]RJL30369.1 hypothetical protein D5H75_22585 [Bailinhaonella thermotolerans]